MQKFYFYKHNGVYIGMSIEPSSMYENEEYEFETFAEAEEYFNNGNPK
jgi:hypothetical protein